MSFERASLKNLHKEVWERNRMDPDMHTMLLDTYSLNLMELHFQKLREQSEKG